MTETAETLLRTTLTAVADRTTVTSDWDRLVADVDAHPPATRASDPTGSNRGRFLMAAAAVAVFAGGMFAIDQLDTNDEVNVTAGTDYVLPGETVLSQNPLIVSAAYGPEPAFDTAGLGEEKVWRPFGSVPLGTQGAIESALAPFGASGADRDATVTKVVALGSLEGIGFTLVILDVPGPSGENERWRSFADDSGSSMSGDLVPAASLDLIEMPPSSVGEPINGPSVETPSGWVTWDQLPSDASVATFTDDETQIWIRVRGGVAVFPAKFSRNETYRVTVLDAEGNQLGEYSDTVDFIVDPNPAVIEVGDVLQPMAEPDVEGNQVTISGSETTVLVYGASWCPHCETVLADALPALEALGDDVVVYSISATEGPDGSAESWPVGDDWPFTRLAPEAGSVLLGTEAYPQTVVLGPDNEVIGSFTGFEDYAERLAEAGAG